MRAISRISAAILLAGAASLAFDPPAFAEVVTLTAALSPGGGGEPQGKGRFTYDTDTMLLKYVVVYDRLSGPATGAEIREDASDGGRVVVAFPVAESPIGGTATLSDDTARELLAGKLVVDVRTGAHDTGEIAGAIHR